MPSPKIDGIFYAWPQQIRYKKRFFSYHIELAKNFKKEEVMTLRKVTNVIGIFQGKPGSDILRQSTLKTWYYTMQEDL